jgi:hypothetical protein
VRGKWERELLRRSGDDGSEGGSEVLEPRPWDQGRWARVLLSAAELPTSYSSEFEAVEHRGRQSHGGRRKTSRPFRPKGLCESENPMSGSGPSESARCRREKTVETVRDREDGRCRAGQARVIRTSDVDVAEGARNPRRGDSARHGRGGLAARTLRGRRSLWELPGGLRTVRTAGRRNTSWS